MFFLPVLILLLTLGDHITAQLFVKIAKTQKEVLDRCAIPIGARPPQFRQGWPIRPRPGLAWPLAFCPGSCDRPPCVRPFVRPKAPEGWRTPRRFAWLVCHRSTRQRFELRWPSTAFSWRSNSQSSFVPPKSNPGPASRCSAAFSSRLWPDARRRPGVRGQRRGGA